jgi:hypothetical protein
MRTSGWARFDKAPSWIPTAAAKTSFRIAFSASEPVICSSNVDFVDAAAAIVCVQTSSIRFVVLFYRHTILSKRCGLFAWLVPKGSGISGPGSLQGRREWLALRLLVDCVKEFRCTLALVETGL